MERGYQHERNEAVNNSALFVPLASVFLFPMSHAAGRYECPVITRTNARNQTLERPARAFSRNEPSVADPFEISTISPSQTESQRVHTPERNPR